MDGNKHGMGGQWSTYWYNGHIYGSEIARGVDVLDLVPSQYLTEAEINAANTVRFDEMNVQAVQRPSRRRARQGLRGRRQGRLKEGRQTCRHARQRRGLRQVPG